jgi:hypothetical protein
VSDHAHVDPAGRGFLTFLVFLAVVAALAAFVVLPGSKLVSEAVGDCSPSAGGTCVSPSHTVLVGDGFAGVRAAVALVGLLAFFVLRSFVRRARRKGRAAASG